MNQNKLKTLLGISAIVFAVVAIALLLIGIIAVNFSTAPFVKIMLIIIAVICMILAAELGYMYLMENDTAPNYFLFDTQAKRNIPVSEYTPLQVKQAVTGYGRAEKKQVITMVTMLLGLKKPPKPDDTADALAIAICHAHSGGSRLAEYYNK